VIDRFKKWRDGETFPQFKFAAITKELIMAELVVNNPNIVNDALNSRTGAKFGRRLSQEHRPETDAALVRQLQQIRRQIEETACSSTWAEDWLYRGAAYAPDFQCKCAACRTLYPNRRYPRPVRESDYSADCQVEANEDPEFAEELARLRNDRPRFGSIFVKSGQQGSHLRKIKSYGGDA
jgi:hypothetical protein